MGRLFLCVGRTDMFSWDALCDIPNLKKIVVSLVSNSNVSKSFIMYYLPAFHQTDARTSDDGIVYQVMDLREEPPMVADDLFRRYHDRTAVIRTEPIDIA